LLLRKLLRLQGRACPPHLDEQDGAGAVSIPRVAAMRGDLPKAIMISRDKLPETVASCGTPPTSGGRWPETSFSDRRDCIDRPHARSLPP